MLTITNNNIYLSDLPLTSIFLYENVDTIIEEDLFLFLNDIVEFGESVTLKRIFDLISKNISIFNDIYYTSLGGYIIDPYLQEIQNNKSEYVNIEYLEFFWVADRLHDNFNIYPALRGISKDGEDCALDFIGLNDIKNCKILLYNSVQLINLNKLQKKSKKPNTYLGEKHFTVNDILNALFSEISYHGGPQDKNERFHELKEKFENINNNKTKDEYFNIDVNIENIIENDIYSVMYNDLYDRVDHNRLKNIENLDKIKNCIIDKLKIYEKIHKSKSKTFYKCYKQITNIEYNIQTLYGEKENIMFHRFWETPKCSCPKIDNIEIYPQKKYIDKHCIIHGNIFKNKKNIP